MNASKSIVVDENIKAEFEANQLFKNNSVEEIRMKESNTRKEIEDKKQELRRLVGNRYRDLIDSADSIIQMRNLMTELDKRVQNMEELCHFLRKKRKKDPEKKSDTQSADRELRRKKYYLGLQIKLLVDTPEQIWSSLESDDYLKATILYLKAETVYSKLTKANDAYSTKILASIPLLFRQWATITQFPPKISHSAKLYLHQNDLLAKDYAGALCSLILLDKTTSKEVFQEFLASRAKALKTTLVASSTPSTDSILSQLCSVAQTACYTVYHVRQIFYDNSSSTKAEEPLLQSLLQTVINPQISTVDPNFMKNAFRSIPIGDIQKACSEWIKHIAAVIQTDGRNLLSYIQKAKDLKLIEEAVWNTIYQVIKPKRVPSTTGLSSPTAVSRSSSTASLESIPESPTMARRNEPELQVDNETGTVGLFDIPWDDVSQLIVNESVPVWSTLFEDIFLERGKQIISSALNKLSLMETVDKTLQLLQKDEGSSLDANVGYYSWSSQEDEKIEITKKKAGGFTPQLDSIIQSFDTQLQSILEDINHLLVIPDPVLLADPKTLGVITAPRPYASAIPKLHFYLQHTFFLSVSNLAQRFEKRIESLEASLHDSNGTPQSSKPHTNGSNIELFTSLYTSYNTFNYAKFNSKGSVVLDQILFIGRISRALYTHSQQLKKLLNDPTPSLAVVSVMQSPLRVSRTPSRIMPSPLPKKAQTKEENSELFLKAQQHLKRQYNFAHAVWVNHLVSDFSSLLEAAICKENWNSPLRSKTWEELTVSVEGEGEKSVEEKIYLPFQPSTFLLSYLYAISNEIFRVGGHTIERIILQYLVYHTSERVMTIFQKLFAKKEEFPKNKEGLIQLLFDTRFIFDVLSGRKEVKESFADMKEFINAASKSTEDKVETDEILEQVMNWTNKVNKLMEKIENELDPIDVLFYGPHVKQSVMKSYKRCIVLFGSLTQLNRLYTSVKQKPSAVQEQPNVIVLAAPVTRFTLLPISTPVLKPSGTLDDRSSKLASSTSNPAGRVNQVPLTKANSFLGSMKDMFSGEKKVEKTKGDTSNLGWFL